MLILPDNRLPGSCLSRQILKAPAGLFLRVHALESYKRGKGVIVYFNRKTAFPDSG